MIINRLIAKNWRNFQQINVPLRERQFIVGPNASGKSNLLDIFRFFRDIVKVDGGGFQNVVFLYRITHAIKEQMTFREQEISTSH